jgi:hypothetical protein
MAKQAQTVSRGQATLPLEEGLSRDWPNELVTVTDDEGAGGAAEARRRLTDARDSAGETTLPW